MDEETLVMPLYWSCQNLHAKLGENPINRKEAIIDTIRENISKFSKYSKEIAFEPELTWYNTSAPLTRKSLEGMITVIDFFTYCCINCMHILPDLEKLEERFPAGLSVLGVHSAKFANEKSEEQLEHAIQRYKIEHPVYNDVSLKLWTSLGVTCWPTLLILSPSGDPIHVLMGEGHSNFLSEYIQTAIEYFSGTGELKMIRPPKSLHSRVGGTRLKYPGKIAAAGDRLAISDSANNRVLILEDLSAPKLQHVIGSGGRGRENGHFSSATFNNPQGVCFVGEDLVMVADTDNHLLRMINIKDFSVSTVGGTGGQGVDKEGGKVGVEQEISSPWDLCKISENAVAVAMAGIHQIWMYCLGPVSWWKGASYPPGTLVRIAGSGAEENRNNSYPAKAGFAQPSGLTFDANYSPAGALYIADSESSTIRRLDLKDGSVKNVCGGERDPTNLFAYGDTDGAGINAKLQHPLAVCWNSGRSELYIADSYNHKIKKVTGPKNDVCTILGSGPGNMVGDLETARVCEPGGLCLSEDSNRLYIADTNNHTIKVLHLDQNSVSSFKIKFPGANEEFDAVFKHRYETGDVSETRLLLEGSIKHPEFKLNPEGKSTWSLENTNGDWKFDPQTGDLNAVSNVGTCSVNVSGSSINSTSVVNMKVKCFLCHKSSGVCIAKNILHEVEIVHVADAPALQSINLGSLVQF